jgi:hypothetical protein
MGTRKPKDILSDIEASDAEEAADRALAMTPEQRAAKLAEAGITAEDVATTGDAWHERMQRAAVDEARRKAEVAARDQATAPRRPSAWYIPLAAALAAAAIVVVAFALRSGGEGAVATPSATGGGPSATMGAGVVEAGVVDAGRPEATAPEAPDASVPVQDKPPLK